MKKGFVYSLICPKTSDVRYVGITIGKLAYRLSKHKKDASKKGHTHKINWLRQLEKENLLERLEISVIEEVNAALLGEREAYWISYFRSVGFDLVNTAPGGSTGSKGYKHSLEVRKRIGEAVAKRQTGKKLSTEHREKISRSLIGTKRRVGKFHTAETKKQISEALQGRQAWNEKPVCQFDKLGTFVNTWKSITEAARSLGLSQGNISEVIAGKRKTCGGFIWKF